MLRALSGLCLVFWAVLAFAQPPVPALTGRVVDRAELLDAAQEAELNRLLAGHEQATGDQLVVVTLPDLGGRSIEETGLTLGREWGIGQKGRDNGALLIVAQAERRIRIEVGYGLEDRLTDAQSALIIHNLIAPAFRQGDFAGGIRAGVEGMIQVVGGEPMEGYLPALGQPAQEQPPLLVLLIVFLVMLAVIGIGGGRGGRGRQARSVMAAAALGALMGRGGGGGFGGGGFGGGGGGFGGGGASGGW
ncbi:methanol dehydrogenase [Pseudomonas flexibilis]|uniref:TPM domain-containing protein n=1 Tax=Pseudomonas flexibilis TaxID=706570 RepID=A0A1N6VIM5_9PSED|nr:TPM domain-containing protein [Pseudomonas flexibilis]KHL70443.1 methanol dehydrogenase [Pseudomonas flexibilis]SIQ77695.1 uncharacterized protein SAMN05421672_11011 [Pseudomonas flexibilis]